MTSAVLVLDELGEQECRRLLGTKPIGRLGFTEGAMPQILPVHYTVRGDQVIVASLFGMNGAAGRGDIVAFEVDDYDPASSEGWCVGVVGPCRLLADPSDIAELDALDFCPLPSERGRTYIAIPISMVHGRRLHKRR